MPTPKVTSPVVEPEVEEQKQETPEIEPASPAEGEPQEQRDETPDPLAEVTFQQLQEHPRFKEDWDNLTRAQGDEQEKQYREGQSAGGKQADEKTREFAAQQEVIKTFEDLEQKRLSQDPDELQEYANAMGKPKVKEAYERGRLAKQGPGAQEIAERAGFEAMNAIYLPLRQHPLLKDMAEEEHLAVYEGFKGKKEPFAQLIKRYCELIAEKGTAAGIIKENAKIIEDAKEGWRKELLDELGMELPSGEIKGGTKTDESVKLDRILVDPHATQEQKADAFEKKHGYRPRNR